MKNNKIIHFDDFELFEETDDDSLSSLDDDDSLSSLDDSLFVVVVTAAIAGLLIGCIWTELFPPSISFLLLLFLLAITTNIIRIIIKIPIIATPIPTPIFPPEVSSLFDEDFWISSNKDPLFKINKLKIQFNY